MKKSTNSVLSYMISKTTGLCLSLMIFGIISFSCLASDSLDDHRPPEHRCPITLGVMKDPVVAADGHSYEREALLGYFNSTRQARSPLTGLPLAHKDFVVNQALKAMIHEWKPGRQSQPSELETRDAHSIAERVKQEFTKNVALLNAAKDQHIVAFLGNTGAGKSTLINLLAGKKLIVSDDEEDYVLADPDDTAAMVIGTKGGSETLYPKSIEANGLHLFDLPGFNDTDGSERNLINAAFTRQILLDAASIRLVFVAGQDQFTADRSASIKQMLHNIKQLFVVDQDHLDLVDNGVFVATKVTCLEKADTVDFLLKKTDARDKAALHDQLKSWNQTNKLCRMFHPLRDKSNLGVRYHILQRIKDIKPTKVRGINVSVLYPSDTAKPLQRMFLSILEKVFDHQMNADVTTLSDYNRSITTYSSTEFWPTFNAHVGQQEPEIDLLKEFCVNPYNNALKQFKQEHEVKRQGHVQTLMTKRQQRIEAIEKKTELRAQEVITALVPHEPSNELVLFDFAYHKDYYDQVCGLRFINQLTSDVLEQEIVRRHYAGFISQHSHTQMLRWYQKFGGVVDLRQQLAATQQRLDSLEEPLIQAQKAAEEEQQKLKQSEIKRAIPPVAQGHEEIYQRFLKGRLIYRPQEGSDVGKIELPIMALANPLEGTFDLSGCGDAGQYLSISTGYRKQKRAENANKVEIWLAPKFLIEKELHTTASHFKDIYSNWSNDAHIGIFWTWGGWDNLNWYDYLTNNSILALSNEDLWKKHGARLRSQSMYTVVLLPAGEVERMDMTVNMRKISCSFCELE